MIFGDMVFVFETDMFGLKRTGLERTGLKPTIFVFGSSVVLCLSRADLYILVYRYISKAISATSEMIRSTSSSIIPFNFG
jgi:hypothetical protein